MCLTNAGTNTEGTSRFEQQYVQVQRGTCITVQEYIQILTGISEYKNLDM